MSDILVDDTLLPHLLDLLSNPASEGLILAGGLGVQLKRQYLRMLEAQTLIPFSGLSAVRPTTDIDFFLLIELFVQTARGESVRRMLDELNYDEHTKHLKFGKPLGIQYAPERKVKIDLLARSPIEGEAVKSDSIRVGKDSGTGLHGRNTPEAFAVEEMPLKIKVEGSDTNDIQRQVSVFVPHSYAWINMKVKAAHDWLRMNKGEIEYKLGSEKHAFDVYMLTAMLTNAEIEEAKTLAQKYAHHPIAIAIKAHAHELYASPYTTGSIEASRQAGKPIEHGIFWEGLCETLGITNP